MCFCFPVGTLCVCVSPCQRVMLNSNWFQTRLMSDSNFMGVCSLVVEKNLFCLKEKQHCF